ncbi:MAG: 3-oxoacyl-[acyl-carrier-protein] synthase III C-terminal domain-containing protein [Succinatimonas sp.]|nr:3-oxoacyl-[acyl-carrier-protein] synthase III C-terminal domain-containing protein [Succinatimonas sp.]
MSLNKFNHVKISGLSVVVPEKEINIYDEVEYYGNDVRKVDRMKKTVGFFKRRVIEDGTTSADLAISAAENLLNGMNIDRQSIDGLVYVVQKQDYHGVVDSYYIHHKLGLKSGTFCTNISQGCAGWVWGLFLCSQLIESGAQKRILLLNADIPTLGLDLSNRNQAPLFGDAGSATLLDYSEENIPSFYGIKTFSDGYGRIIPPAGGTRLREDRRLLREDPYNKPLYEYFETNKGYKVRLFDGLLDGNAVFSFTMNEVPVNIKETLEFASLSQSDISYCCLHQANKQIVQSVAQFSGFSLDRTPFETFSKYGNNTMCSIPTVLSDLFDEKKSFDEKPYLCCGFGNGLVSATGILPLKGAFCTGVRTYKESSDHMTRDQLIEYWKKKMIETN